MSVRRCLTFQLRSGHPRRSAAFCFRHWASNDPLITSVKPLVFPADRGGWAMPEASRADSAEKSSYFLAGHGRSAPAIQPVAHLGAVDFCRGWSSVLSGFRKMVRRHGMSYIRLCRRVAPAAALTVLAILTHFITRAMVAALIALVPDVGRARAMLVVTPPRPAAWRFRAVVAAGLAAAVLLSVALLALGGRDAWAQVAKTLQSQPWVRCTLRMPAGVEVPPGLRAPGNLPLREEQERRAAVHEGGAVR